MNKVQILNKIARDLGQLQITAVQGAGFVTVDNLVISTVDAQIQTPMGGIDGSVSPFLGMGIASPGQLKLKGAAGQNTLAAIFTSALRMQVLALMAGFANDIVIEAGDTTAQLAYIRGHADLLGMGQ